MLHLFLLYTLSEKGSLFLLTNLTLVNTILALRPGVKYDTVQKDGAYV